MLLFTKSDCRQLSRCELVYELRRHGFPEQLMSDWVCLVEHASDRRTHHVSPPRQDGSKTYGLFQVNDRHWCSNTSSPGKECNVTCRQLLSDDITRAAACAKKVYQRHGFIAWNTWVLNCQESSELSSAIVVFEEDPGSLLKY
ncbi:lysozyme-like [Battus philenor]|uniref:lysozyme-like n=1 Tax=Battus philenor TaxID=42288 RepID=UPI0035CEACDB